MQTYEQAKRVFATARNPLAGKPLENNTRLYRRGDDCFAVRLHSTDVVTYWADGRIVLDTGGWQTMTTKARIGSYADVNLYSERGVWYVSHRANPGPVPYFDGIEFTASGECSNGPTPSIWAEYLSDRKAMDKRIQSYCTAFNRALAKDGIPMPSGGDCWYCSMYTDERQPLGDASNSHSHLLDHMDESYFVPSLIVNALRAHGYNDTGIYFQLHMNPDADTMGGPGSRYVDSGQRRTLLKYLRDRLLPVPPGPNAEQRQMVRAYKGACDY